MKLVEIANGISVNPEKVTSVRIEKHVRNFQAGVKYGDLTSLVYSSCHFSDYSYEETIRRLTEV